MSRQQFNTGQEILSADLNSIQGRQERGLFNWLVYELIGRKTDGFFQDGFKVLRTGATGISVTAGLGFQTVSDTDVKEPYRKPLYLGSAHVASVNAAHATLPRIDIVSVKANREDLEIETRRYKEEFNDTIFTEDFTISTEWKADVLVTAGTAAGSPVAPATPAGYIKIAEIYVTAVTGIANQAAITDSRVLLPFSSYTTFGGSNYDAVVGTASFCTHATINDVMSDANVANIKNILVINHAALTASQVINQNDVRIEFKKGAVLTAGAYSTTALSINANGCEVIGAKFSGFTTGLQIEATKKNNVITRCRFVACTTDITDNGTNNELQMNMVEV